MCNWTEYRTRALSVKMTGVQLDVRKAVSCSNDLSGRLKNLSDDLSNIITTPTTN